MIAHFDIDSFFVSVELVKEPSLAGKSVIVGGSRERGIVTTCSYEARKFGVHSAMPMKQAISLCPHAIVLRGNYADYSHYSHWVTNIIAAQAPLFEKASIDEFYLDLEGMDKYHNAVQWTLALRELITAETGLPISFGIARNKMLAKMATNESKPNGYLVIPGGKEKDFLAPLDIGKIPGVGEQTEKVLKHHGIRIVGDLYKRSREDMQNQFGNWAADLWQRAQGTHVSSISRHLGAKSISTENTFETNITKVNYLLSEIVRMTEKIAFELRRSVKMSTCITIKIRYENFETVSRQVTVPPTCSDDEIIPVAKLLFERLYTKGRPVRLLGVRLSSLVENALQPELFTDPEKKRTLYKAIDNVKNRFGTDSISRAAGRLSSRDKDIL